MIYLIGGPPRSGKTLIAERLADALAARLISLDSLRSALEQQHPELGVRNGNDAELNAGRMWQQVEILIDEEMRRGGDCVIEGADLQPMLVRELKTDENIHILFVGYGSISVANKIAAIKAHADEGNEWTSSLSTEQLERLVGDEISRSQRFQKQCQEYGIDYVDTGADFIDTIATAEARLKDGVNATR